MPFLCVCLRGSARESELVHPIKPTSSASTFCISLNSSLCFSSICWAPICSIFYFSFIWAAHLLDPLRLLHLGLQEDTAHMGTGTLDLLGGLARPPSDLPAQMPASSQLTIFYSGTVNVYNDVSAEKAHAIMLLLENGDEKHRRGIDASVAGALTNLSAPMMSPAPVGISAAFKQPLSRASTPPPMSPFLASQPPMSPFPASQPERKPQLISKRSQAELPFARKASLARFLEKRKDRVQAKVENSAEEEIHGGTSKRSKPSDDEACPSK